MASPPSPNPSIIVYRGLDIPPGAYVWSAFVNKLECRLRFGGLSYRTEPGNFIQAPRGKIPWIQISGNGSPDGKSSAQTSISDSALISKDLVERGLLGEDLNTRLSPVGKAQDLALRALLEDKLYFYQNHEIWIQNYYTMRSKVLSALPYPLQLLVGLFIYRNMKSALYGQGTLRFTPEEIDKLRREGWESIDELLSASKRKRSENDDKDSTLPFWVLGGDTPTEADTTVFGFVSSLLVNEAAPETGKLVRHLPYVMEYARRIHDVYFPDYALWEER